MKMKAFAKINLGLRILSKRKDGYHNIDTIFAEVDLADDLTFQLRDDGEIRVQGIDVANEKNSVFQAAWLLQRLVPVKTGIQETKLGVDVTVDKKIPMEAGLGGGSSDAAVTLKALNTLWELNLEEKRLEHLALKLGADVPFFIRGGVQRGRGIGERLSPMELPKSVAKHVMVVVPSLRVSTEWAFNSIKVPSEKSIQDTAYPPSLKLRRTGSIQNLENDFESLVFTKFSHLKNIKSALRRYGAVGASLSGSGSALYGLFQSKKAAREAAGKLEGYGEEVFVCSVLS